jgi:hypothetical protein
MSKEIKAGDRVQMSSTFENEARRCIEWETERRATKEEIGIFTLGYLHGRETGETVSPEEHRKMRVAHFGEHAVQKQDEHLRAKRERLTRLGLALGDPVPATE